MLGALGSASARTLKKSKLYYVTISAVDIQQLTLVFFYGIVQFHLLQLLVFNFCTF